MKDASGKVIQVGDILFKEYEMHLIISFTSRHIKTLSRRLYGGRFSSTIVKKSNYGLVLPATIENREFFLDKVETTEEDKEVIMTAFQTYDNNNK